MTANQIVREYEADKITGVMAFGYSNPEKPIELVYYTERHATIEQISAKLEAGAFCIGWVGLQKGPAVYLRVPKEMKPHYAECVQYLRRVVSELLARDPRHLQ